MLCPWSRTRPHGAGVIVGGFFIAVSKIRMGIKLHHTHRPPRTDHTFQSPRRDGVFTAQNHGNPPFRHNGGYPGGKGIQNSIRRSITIMGYFRINAFFRRNAEPVIKLKLLGSGEDGRRAPCGSFPVGHCFFVRNGDHMKQSLIGIHLAQFRCQKGGVNDHDSRSL